MCRACLILGRKDVIRCQVWLAMIKTTLSTLGKVFDLLGAQFFEDALLTPSSLLVVKVGKHLIVGEKIILVFQLCRQHIDSKPKPKLKHVKQHTKT
jgi:hypothetical protein